MIIFMGPAGSGKSVQGELLCQRFGFTWLSTGVLLRAAAETEELREVMEQGHLIDDALVERILQVAMDEMEDTSRVILDGFPRNTDQADWLKGYVTAHPERHLALVVHIDLGLSVAKQRLLNRGRTDDTERAIEERFKEYIAVTMPMIEWYRRENIPVALINGDHEIETVHEGVVAALRSHGVVES